MDQKVRDRTKEELTTRKNEFLKICDVLDNLEIKYFLTSGILLGAIRDNDFIKWDWDVELSVFVDDFIPKIDIIVDEIKNANFKIDKIIRHKDNSKIDFIGSLPKNVTAYTIYAFRYSRIRNVFFRKELTIPARFLDNFTKIIFLGREFNCPLYVEEYLSFVYGDWKKPLRTSDKKIYLTKNYKKRTFFFIVFIEKILMKINSFILIIKNIFKSI
jgi:phosphorylcholine metabolism protein LicD